MGFGQVTLKVWGDFACFTRPEMPVERVSYDVMTPGAARGILEAIYWKPQFDWIVEEIHVLNPISKILIRTNELIKRQNPNEARRGKVIVLSDQGVRTQRYTLALIDVAYLIKARIQLREQFHKENRREATIKHYEMFNRRVSRGQFFHHPYLGRREFLASFSHPTGDEKPIEITTDLGTTFLDFVFTPHPKGVLEVYSHTEDGRTLIKGEMTPTFFQARLENGVLYVPERDLGAVA